LIRSSRYRPIRASTLGDLFGLHRRGQFLDDTGDDRRVLGGHNPVGLGGRHGRQQRWQQFTGQPAPRTQIDRGVVTGGGLVRRQPQHIPQQGLGVAGSQFTGDPALIQFGDQGVIHDRQPAALRFQPAQQAQQVVTVQAGELEPGKRVDRGRELTQCRLNNGSG
jgi:hypothetical protein